MASSSNKSNEGQWSEAELKCLLDIFTRENYDIYKPPKDACQQVSEQLTQLGFNRSASGVAGKIPKLLQKFQTIKKGFLSGRRTSTDWSFFMALSQLVDASPTKSKQLRKKRQKKAGKELKQEDNDDDEDEDDEESTEEEPQQQQKQEEPEWSTDEINSLLSVFKHNFNFSFASPSTHACENVAEVLASQCHSQRSTDSVKVQIQYLIARYQHFTILKEGQTATLTEEELNWPYYSQVQELIQRPRKWQPEPWQVRGQWQLGQHRQGVRQQSPRPPQQFIGQQWAGGQYQQLHPVGQPQWTGNFYQQQWQVGQQQWIRDSHQQQQWSPRDQYEQQWTRGQFQQQGPPGQEQWVGGQHQYQYSWTGATGGQQQWKRGQYQQRWPRQQWSAGQQLQWPNGNNGPNFSSR